MGRRGLVQAMLIAFDGDQVVRAALSYRSLIRDVRRVWLHAQPGSEEAALDKAGLVLDLLQAVPDDLDQVSEAGYGEVGQDAALEPGPDPFNRLQGPGG